MRINHQVVVFDAADLAAESSFWAGVLEGTVDAEGDWHMVFVDGEPRVGVQLAPNHVPPDWPDGTPQQQLHVDLWVDDFKAAHEKVVSLGARARTGPPVFDAVRTQRGPGSGGQEAIRHPWPSIAGRAVAPPACRAT